MDKARFGVVIASALCALAACGGAKQTGPAATAGGGVAKAEAGCGASSAVVPIGSPSGSSTVALARVSGRRVAFVADEDAKAILTVDLDTREQLAQTSLGARPGQLLVTKDGRVLATVREGSKVLSLAATSATAPLATRCEATTPVEPIAIALTPDDGTMLVASGWGAALSAFDAATLTPRWTAPLSREPRSVVVSDDGTTAFVSHAVGSQVSTVDIREGNWRAVSTIPLRGLQPSTLDLLEQEHATPASSEPSTKAHARAVMAMRAERDKGRPSCQGFTLAKAKVVPGRVFAPEVFVDPGNLDERPDGYGDVHQDTEVPNVAVLDEGTKTPLLTSVALDAMGRSSRQRKMASADPRTTRPECLLPRAAAIDTTTRSLLVTCFGIDAVVAYDAESPAPFRAEKRRWTVGSGPSGVAIDEEKHRGVVWSQFDRTVTTFPIGGREMVDERTAPTTVARTALPPLKDKLPAEYALGRVLFHAAGDLRLSGDGRACASCHPDGRDDGITWATPEGPRRSIMLAGKVTATPPYSWNGTEHTIANHLSSTFDRLSGNGLHGIELDALVTFVSQMPPPPARTIDAAERAKVERGRQVFASNETKCASCHAGSDMTDGRNHEVASKHKADRATAFNTPSLRFVGGTGPYFHDGRYASLKELLDATDGTMGKTKHLAAADRDALEAFLRTL